MLRIPKVYIVGILGFVLVSVIAVQMRGKEVTIERNTDGFFPQKIIIQKGDTIKFVNTTNQDVWPASNAHPTHGLYAAFDPKEGVPPGASWNFTFDTAGTWAYHDHIYPQYTGTIIVVGKPGEARDNCLAIGAKNTISCFEGDMVDTLEKDGLDAALDLLKQWYVSDPAFQPQCHDVTHILGVAAYKKYADNHQVVHRPEVSYCGYGFYHGFMEEMLVSSGAGQYEEIRAYCTSLRTGKSLDNLAASCYHGVGHAMFDSLDGRDRGKDLLMTNRALALCPEAFSDEEEILQCASGVFNALDVAYNNKAYGLSFDQPNPLHVCEAQPKKYKPNCYLFVAIGVLHYRALNHEDALRFIRAIPDAEAREKTLFGYIGDVVRRTIANVDLISLQSMCESFAGDSREACVNGVTAGLRESGTPGTEYKQMFAFCELLTDKVLHALCRQTTIRSSRPIATDKEDFVRVCLSTKEASARAVCK